MLYYSTELQKFLVFHNNMKHATRKMVKVKTSEAAEANIHMKFQLGRIGQFSKKDWIKSRMPLTALKRSVPFNYILETCILAKTLCDL